MADFSRLLVQIDATTEQLRRELARADTAVGATQRSINTRLGAIDQRFARLGSTISTVGRSFVGALGPLAGALSVRQIVSYSDAWQNLQGRLKLVTSDSEDLATTTTRLFGIAQQTRVAFDDVGNLYARLARSTQELGVSQGDLLQVTQAINQAVIVSGASAQEASAGLIQLSQGLASGALRGDELRSVLEQLPRVAQAIADGLGVTIGQLRELGTTGQLTSEKVFGALLGQAGKLRDEFGRMPETVGQALTKVSNSFEFLIGNLNASTEATSGLTGALDQLAAGIASLEFATAIEDTFGALARFAAEAQTGVEDLAGALSRLSQSAGIADLGQALKALASASPTETLKSTAQDINNITGVLTGLRTALEGGASDPSAALEDVNNQIETALKRLRELLDQGYTDATSVAVRKQKELIEALKGQQARLAVDVNRQQIDQALEGLAPSADATKRLLSRLDQASAVATATATATKARPKVAIVVAPLKIEPEQTAAIKQQFEALADGAKVIEKAQRDAAQAAADAQTEAANKVIDAWARVADQQNEISNRTEQTGLALRQSLDPGNVLSNQLIGTNTTGARVESRLLDLQQQGFSQEQIKSLQAGIQADEELNTKFALTNTLMTTLSDSAAQLGTTLLFEGSEEAGQQLLKMLVQMGIQIAANLAVALLLNAALGGAPAVGGAGAGAGSAGLLVGAFPFRASGGPVRAREPVIVGEAGSELFVPSTSGHIIAHHQLRHFADGSFPAMRPPDASEKNSGPVVSFKIIDQRQAGSPPIEFSQQTGPDGRTTATAIVRGGLSEMHRTGELATFLGRGYGVRPSPR